MSAVIRECVTLRYSLVRDVLCDREYRVDSRVDRGTHDDNRQCLFRFSRSLHGAASRRCEVAVGYPKPRRSHTYIHSVASNGHPGSRAERRIFRRFPKCKRVSGVPYESTSDHCVALINRGDVISRVFSNDRSYPRERSDQWDHRRTRE